MNEGRVAVIAIGNSEALNQLQIIANSLDVPFLSIKWNSYDREYNVYFDHEESMHGNVQLIQETNLHPSALKLSEAIYDFVLHNNWRFVTILYQESLGLDRIQGLINMPATNSKIRLQVRQLSHNVHDWIYLLKEIKLSGSSHIIVDIETQYINDFIDQVLVQDCMV